jgi:hypothetical protein
MIYETTNCFPDMYDLERLLTRFKVAGNAEELYQDFRAAHEWLHIAIHASRRHGRHIYTPLSEIKETAEGFIGRTLSESAFLVAAKNDRKARGEGFAEAKSKVPPFDVEGIKVLWEKHTKDETAGAGETR